jgi:hypothetical protein
MVMQILEFVEPINIHSRLNPLLWDGQVLKPQIRLKLLDIAHEFIKYIKLDELPLRDIVITGSNTALTYTKYSDLDLHIIIDMRAMNAPREVIEQMFDAKRRLWNATYDISVKGIAVELYVEHSEEHVEGTAYSIMEDQWRERQIKEPQKINQRAVQAKYNSIVRQLERVLTRSTRVEDLRDIMDSLKKFRQAGLDRYGEFSTENLVFKSLRNAGWIEQIAQRRQQLTNAELSLDEKMIFDTISN